jgi:two-component system response regulator YesN
MRDVGQMSYKTQKILVLITFLFVPITLLAMFSYYAAANLIGQCRLEPEEIFSLCKKIVYIAAKEISLFQDELDRLYGTGFDLRREIEGLHLYDIQRRLSDILQRVVSAVCEQRDRQGKRVIEAVKQIIIREYDKHLELAELSERVHLNPSYLSRMFKQETGETVTNYLIRVRIEKAKELLSGEMGLNVYEVSEKVGYSDSMYFTKLFKRMVGVTPKEYAEKYGR